MRRRTFLLSAGAGSAVILAGCSGDDSDPDFRESFEDGLGDWETTAAIGPEVNIEDFEWSIEVWDEEAADGDRSLRITNEGDYDDGTTWAVHTLPIESGERYEPTVRAQFWSQSESFNTLRNAVMYLGPERPEREGDFPDPGVNTTQLGETAYGGLREPLHLAEGWREYSFTWTTPTLSVDTLYLALGTTVVWETAATHYVDDVRVDLDPQ